MTTEKQLWIGYYQLTYLNQPNTLYFDHLIGFAKNRDIFQQRIEDYKTHYQCKLSSQLAPLPATTWFQRHGYQATVWAVAQQLKEQELRFFTCTTRNSTRHPILFIARKFNDFASAVNI